MEQRYLLTLFQMELLLSFCFIGQKIVPLLDKKFVNSLPIYIYIYIYKVPSIPFIHLYRPALCALYRSTNERIPPRNIEAWRECRLHEHFNKTLWTKFHFVTVNRCRLINLPSPFIRFPQAVFSPIEENPAVIQRLCPRWNRVTPPPPSFSSSCRQLSRKARKEEIGAIKDPLKNLEERTFLFSSVFFCFEWIFSTFQKIW